MIARCRPARAYTKREIAITKIIAPHLENFYDVLCMAERGPAEFRFQSVKEKAVCFGLTRREQEVAFLLSERLSMSEIADRLYISTRTVESHAQHIYAKLGIQKKRELGDYFLPQREPIPLEWQTGKRN